MRLKSSEYLENVNRPCDPGVLPLPRVPPGGWRWRLVAPGGELVAPGGLCQARRRPVAQHPLRLLPAAETDERGLVCRHRILATTRMFRLPAAASSCCLEGEESWHRCQPASLPLGNMAGGPRGPETTTVSSWASGDAIRAVSPYRHSRPLSCQPRGLGRIPRAARPVHLHAVSEADSSLLWNSGKALPCHDPCLGLRAFPVDHHRLPGLPHRRSRRAAQGGSRSGIGTKRGSAVEVREDETPLWGLLL